jgi:thiol-disulfide isomerase/thioredoxin
MIISKTQIIVLIVLIFVLVLAGLYTYFNSKSSKVESSEANRVLGVISEKPGQFTDLEGNPFSFKEHKGKVIVANSWASWCPFCLNELSDFAKLSKEFSTDEVVVVAINRKESNEVAKLFLMEIKDTGNIIFVQDPKDDFYKSISGFAMPETAIYNKAGNLSYQKRGHMKLPEMMTQVNQALSTDQNK